MFQICERRTWIACALGAVFLTAAGGSAHAATGIGTLGAAPSAADLLHVSCFDDGSGAPGSLTGSVEDLAPAVAPFVSLQLTKDAAATNTTDPIDADAAAGPLVWVNGGAGDYDVFVDKSAAGEESYRVTLQCMTGTDGAGVATGTLVTGLAGPPSVPAIGSLARALLVAGLAVAGARRASRAGSRR